MKLKTKEGTMGNSTVIEFNHDTMHEIFDDETKCLKFLDQLRNQMNYGYPNTSQRGDDYMIGCKLVFFSHRDDPPYLMFEEFKQKLRQYRHRERPVPLGPSAPKE
jgi:hypothetical protein